VTSWGIWGPIEPDRIEAILLTYRIGPRHRDWFTRIRTMQQVECHAAPELAQRLHAEITAMFEARDDTIRRDWERNHEERVADTAAMLWCPLRDASVIGVNTDRLPRRGRPCFICGKPLGGRRTRWCSDPCWQLWFSNHEWQAASGAAMRRDGRKCVKCGSQDGIEVNHMDPRYGRGYHQGCHHHLDRLETLCHNCHVIETNRQRAERVSSAGAAAPPEGGPT
jgi:5-methylcytosine-specific restriction endonuclease McrA